MIMLSTNINIHSSIMEHFTVCLINCKISVLLSDVFRVISVLMFYNVL